MLFTTEWEKYKDSVDMSDISDVDNDVMEAAFYAGALTALELTSTHDTNSLLLEVVRGIKDKAEKYLEENSPYAD